MKNPLNDKLEVQFPVQNKSQKTNAEYKSYQSSDFSCQECHKNEAVIKLQGSGWMMKIQGNYCENCAIKKIKYWYDEKASHFDSLLCNDCGRWRDQQTENEKVLRKLDTKELLKEAQCRMKGVNN